MRIPILTDNSVPILAQIADEDETTATRTAIPAETEYGVSTGAIIKPFCTLKVHDVYSDMAH